MKGKLVPLMICTAFALSLSACATVKEQPASKENSTGEIISEHVVCENALPDNIRKEIADAYYSLDNIIFGNIYKDESVLENFKYFGTYNGAHVIYVPGRIHDEPQICELVGETNFVYCDCSRIDVIVDGEIMTLSDAYWNNGILTYDDVKNIKYRYEIDFTISNEIEIDSEDSFDTSLPNEIKHEIIEVYSAVYSQYGNADLSLLDSIEYYGTYNGAHAVKADKRTFLCACYFEIVDGVIFNYSTDIAIDIVFNDSLLTLREAYDNGILSKSDLIEIQKKYYGKCFDGEKIVPIGFTHYRK